MSIAPTVRWPFVVRCAALISAIAVLVLLADFSNSNFGYLSSSVVVASQAEVDDTSVDKPVAMVSTFLFPDYFVNEVVEKNMEAVERSTIMIHDSVIEGFDPSIEEIENMPIARVGLFHDVTVDVEFHTGRSRWITDPPWDFEKDSANAPDGFILTGRILEPYAGYVILSVRSGVARIFGHVKGMGDILITPSDFMFHETRMYWPIDSENPEKEQTLLPTHISSRLKGPGLQPIQGNSDGLKYHPPNSCDGGCDDGCTIDIIVLYTPEAAEAIDGVPEPHQVYEDVYEAIDVAISLANVAFEVSGVSEAPLLRLLYAGEVEAEQGQLMNCINSAYPVTPECEFVRPLRDTLRADLISLIKDSGNGEARSPDSFDPSDEETAFTSNVPYNGISSHTFAHEIGHNFGCKHAPQNHPASCPDFPIIFEDGNCEVCEVSGAPDWARGYNFGSIADDEMYRTIMSTITNTSGTVRVNQYSSADPNIVYEGKYNDYITGAEECADCAGLMSGDAEEDLWGMKYLISQYRTSHDSTGEVTQTSRDHWYGLEPDSAAATPRISGNGQDTVFTAPMIESSTSDALRVYLFNRESRMLESIPSQSTEHNYVNPSITANRRSVAYTKEGLGTGPNHQKYHQIYVHDRLVITDDTQLITGVSGNGNSDKPTANEDGTQIAFESMASNLVFYCPDCPGCNELQNPCDAWSKIYVRDMDSETTVLLSRNSSGNLANADAYRPAISANGYFVAFESEATNLDEFDTANCGPEHDEPCMNIWIRDRDANENGKFDGSGDSDVLTERISTAWDEPAEIPDGHSMNVSVSGDGQIVAYQTTMTNALPSVALDDNVWDIVVMNRETGARSVVSLHYDGMESSNGNSINPSVSANGKWLVFESDSTNLVHGITTERSRIYVVAIPHDWRYSIVQVIDADDIEEYSDGHCTSPTISDDGRFIGFEFTPIDPNEPTQTYVYDRGPMLPGDLNGDGVVDNDDLDILFQNWGECDCCAADLTGDGFVGPDDYQVLLLNWTDEGTDPDPQPTDTCEGQCGGQSLSGCWCDEDCCMFGDCCDDKLTHCGGCDPEELDLCDGHCGSADPALGCFCDEACCELLDCCPGKRATCGGCSPSRP